ncbi:MAG: DUF7146 domain-containing protein [Aestuariivirga sp.]
MSNSTSRAGSPARDLSVQLADRVEAVCRHYLSNGRRSGGYWIVGDTGNAKGRSLFVRLTGPATGKGARGRWQDSATDQFGDLLDLIAAREGYRSLSETLAEARRFLGMPERVHDDGYARDQHQKPRTDTSFIAHRIWSEGLPLAGTLAERYLKARSLEPPYSANLRFHPGLEYRCYRTGEITYHPALLAAVRDASGGLRGIQRTWLAPEGGKAPLDDPRRSLGHLHGHGVWLRHGDSLRNGGSRHHSGILLIGEGVETVLSLRNVISSTAPDAGLAPFVELVAALSASHLAGFILPSRVRHLIVARDNDPAGIRAARTLAARATDLGISVTILRPVLKDFNADLRQLGRDVLNSTIQRQCPALLAA